jgi:hypothetical protein
LYFYVVPLSFVLFPEVCTTIRHFCRRKHLFSSLNQHESSYTSATSNLIFGRCKSVGGSMSCTYITSSRFSRETLSDIEGVHVCPPHSIPPQSCCPAFSWMRIACSLFMVNDESVVARRSRTAQPSSWEGTNTFGIWNGKFLTLWYRKCHLESRLTSIRFHVCSEQGKNKQQYHNWRRSLRQGIACHQEVKVAIVFCNRRFFTRPLLRQGQNIPAGRL